MAVPLLVTEIVIAFLESDLENVLLLHRKVWDLHVSKFYLFSTEQGKPTHHTIFGLFVHLCVFLIHDVLALRTIKRAAIL